jgi:hypothetical protein
VGKPSKVTYTLALPAGTVTGKVLSGQFKGDALSGHVTLTPGTGQNCTTTPITTFTVSGTNSFS